MKVFRSIEALDASVAGGVLTIGNFDGVHRGHQQILAQAGLLAANVDGPVVAMTFDPHPLSVVTPERAPETITPVEEKVRRLGEAEVDAIVVAPSTPALLSLTPDAFVEQIVMPRFRPQCMVEGASFGFGRGRAGDVDVLRQLGKRHGFEVHVVEPVRLAIDEHEQVLVSSSMIRGLLGRGRVRRAALCLGHPYVLAGQVVRGAQRGRSLGFPTANLSIDSQQLIPARAVYAGRTQVGDRTIAAAISIGTNATFDGTQVSIEAHLLDFDADLYGQSLRLEFVNRVRDQRKFESPDALHQQLQRDVETVRSMVE